MAINSLHEMVKHAEEENMQKQAQQGISERDAMSAGGGAAAGLGGGYLWNQQARSKRHSKYEDFMDAAEKGDVDVKGAARAEERLINEVGEGQGDHLVDANKVDEPADMFKQIDDHARSGDSTAQKLLRTYGDEVDDFTASTPTLTKRLGRYALPAAGLASLAGGASYLAG